MFELDGEATVQALAKAVASAAQMAEQARAAGRHDWWKPREAALLAVGSASERLAALGAAGCDLGPLQAAAVAQGLLGEELKPPAAGAPGGGVSPFLRGRALWLCSKLAPSLPEEFVAPILHAAVAAMTPSSPAALRIGACRCVSAAAPRVPAAALRPLLPSVYSALASLLSEISEEALHLVLDALLEVVKADPEAAAAAEPQLAPLLLQLWGRHFNDPSLSGDAAELLSALARSGPAAEEAVFRKALPPLAALLRTPDAQPLGLVESALDLVTVLLRQPPAQRGAARAAHAELFSPAVALALHSQDVGVMQSACECLRALLRGAGDAQTLREWGCDGAGAGDAAAALFSAAARLLSPDLEERAAVFVGPLLTALAQRAPGLVQPLLPEILRAVVRRMRTAEVPMVLTSLVRVFPPLALADAGGLLDMLERIPLENPTAEEGSTALEFVMRQWTQWAGEISGAFAIKESTAALVAVLCSGHRALATLAVRGKEIEVVTGIRTRARAKAAGAQQPTFEQVPLGAKLLALVADALLEAEEADAAQWVEDGADGDGDEGGDGDSDSDDGARTHPRAATAPFPPPPAARLSPCGEPSQAHSRSPPSCLR